MSAESSSLPPRLSLQLLDSSSGAVLQTWHFDDYTRITLGRATECDIRVGDQLVSRLHAELQLVDECWWIISHGRNGLLIDGERHDRCQLHDRATVQLGPSGPTFAVRFERPANETVATLAESAQSFIPLWIDKKKTELEVKEITEGSYFQKLREKVTELRRQP